jgi:hypothetical protein
MPDFADADLRGSRFDHADLSEAQFRAVDLAGAQFRGVDLSGAVMRGVELAGADIHGEVGELTINGVTIGPLIKHRLYAERDLDALEARSVSEGDPA